MFKLALFLALVTLAAGAALSTSERKFASHEPKCYLAYKKCCSYKKPVYGKCHKQTCHNVKKCKNVHKPHSKHQTKKQCRLEKVCKKEEYDCIKRYDEGFNCEHEKKKYGAFRDW